MVSFPSASAPVRVPVCIEVVVTTAPTERESEVWVEYVLFCPMVDVVPYVVFPWIRSIDQTTYRSCTHSTGQEG